MQLFKLLSTVILKLVALVFALGLLVVLFVVSWGLSGGNVLTGTLIMLCLLIGYVGISLYFENMPGFLNWSTLPISLSGVVTAPIEKRSLYRKLGLLIVTICGISIFVLANYF